MSILGRLFGYISVLVNLALAIILLGMGLIGALSGSDMRLDVIPASEEAMAEVLLFSGIGGLIAVAFALRPGRISRTLLLLWSLLITGILVYAFIRPDYRFEGEEHLRLGVWMFLASLALLLGSFLHWKLAKRKER